MSSNSTTLRNQCDCESRDWPEVSVIGSVDIQIAGFDNAMKFRYSDKSAAQVVVESLYPGHTVSEASQNESRRVDVDHGCLDLSCSSRCQSTYWRGLPLISTLLRGNVRVLSSRSRVTPQEKQMRPFCNQANQLYVLADTLLLSVPKKFYRADLPLKQRTVLTSGWLEGEGHCESCKLSESGKNRRSRVYVRGLRPIRVRARNTHLWSQPDCK